MRPIGGSALMIACSRLTIIWVLLIGLVGLIGGKCTGMPRDDRVCPRGDWRVKGNPPRCERCRPGYTRPRASASSRGYDSIYRRWRISRLRLNPLCEDCELAASAEVHHIVKLKDGGKNSVENTIALCKTCHIARTIKGE